MQEILSSQGKVDLNSVHKLQQQSLIVLLPLTQTYCSIFYPCNNMLHRFMHADAQAAHLTLQPAPWSPLSLPGPHKHPRGRLRAPGNDGQQVASAAKKISFFSLTQTTPAKRATDRSLLLAYFLLRNTSDFFVSVQFVCADLHSLLQPDAILHCVSSHLLLGMSQHQSEGMLSLPTGCMAQQNSNSHSQAGREKIWDQKPNLHCLNILLSPNLILNGSDQSALSTKAAKSCKTSGFVLKRTRQGTANFTSYGTARQLQ